MWSQGKLFVFTLESGADLLDIFHTAEAAMAAHPGAWHQDADGDWQSDTYMYIVKREVQ